MLTSFSPAEKKQFIAELVAHKKEFSLWHLVSVKSTHEAEETPQMALILRELFSAEEALCLLLSSRSLLLAVKSPSAVLPQDTAAVVAATLGVHSSTKATRLTLEGLSELL